MSADMNTLLPQNDAEVEGAVVIDPKYEYISAPKYFDFAKEERPEDIVAVEAWFEQAPADTESPQVTKARAKGKGYSALAFRSEHEAMDAEETAAAAEHEDMLVESLVAPRMAPAPDLPQPGVADGSRAHPHPMETRSKSELKKAADTPQRAQSHMDVDSPPSALRAKSLYSELCDPALLALPIPEAPPLTRGRAARREREATAASHAQEPVTKKRKLNEGSLRQILDPRGPVLPARSTAPLTIPHDFHFHTDHRMRASDQAGGQKSPYVPMAEKILRFQKKTPPRFHTVPPSRNHPVVEYSDLHLTVPLETTFETAQRARPSNLKPAEERELEALAAAPRFKARPFSSELLQAAAPAGVHPVAKVPLTQIQEFQFATAHRALHHPRAEPPVTRSASKRVVERREGPPQLTRATQPVLKTATRARVSMVKSREELEAEEVAAMPKFKARPLNTKIFGGARRASSKPKPPPSVAAPREFPDPVRSWNGAPTVPHPFSLTTDDRGAEKSGRFHRQIEAERLELRSRSVPRALPLPLTTDFPKPPPKPLAPPPTIPVPFHLLGLQRAAEEEKKREEEGRQQEAMEAQRTKFTARPNRTKLVGAFVPQRSRKPLTRLQEFSHHADSRAVERKQFDVRVRSKAEEMEEMRSRYEVQKKEEEEKAIREMRKAMVPHPRPMPSFMRSQAGTPALTAVRGRYPNLRSQMR